VQTASCRNSWSNRPQTRSGDSFTDFKSTPPKIVQKHPCEAGFRLKTPPSTGQQWFLSEIVDKRKLPEGLGLNWLSDKVEFVDGAASFREYGDDRIVPKTKGDAP